MSNLDAFFATVKLPTISEVGQGLIKTLDDEDATVGAVRDLIAKDPALSAKLLRLANSAQFGLARSVSSLDDAVNLVGMSKVRTLALAACLGDAFPKLPGLNAADFWRGSMACAGQAQWLAGAVGADGSQAWLTGMMLRLGELLIGQADPATLQEIEKLPQLPGVRWEREKRLIGHTEGQITGDMNTRYTNRMTSTTTGAAVAHMNRTTAMTAEGVFEGPCPADMKPGDMEIPGGMRFNMIEMAEGAAKMGAP